MLVVMFLTRCYCDDLQRLNPLMRVQACTIESHTPAALSSLDALTTLGSAAQDAALKQLEAHQRVLTALQHHSQVRLMSLFLENVSYLLTS